MGYKSCVAMMVYGDPEQVDIVDAMLLQKLNPEYERDLFERVKQMADEELKNTYPILKRRTILWTFDDIKWYSDLQEYQNSVMSWVDDIESERDANDKRLNLCYEFVRVGEENTDVEEERSMNSDYRICARHSIDIPNNFEWRI